MQITCINFEPAKLLKCLKKKKKKEEKKKKDLLKVLQYNTFETFLFRKVCNHQGSRDLWKFKCKIYTFLKAKRNKITKLIYTKSKH